MPTIRELRDCTPEGYNRAALLYPGDDPADLDALQRESFPVLKEAEGALGVLRALDLPGKLQGIQEAMIHYNETRRLVHLIFLPNGAAQIKYWDIKFRPKVDAE
jgi:hypothetical protein